MFWGCFKIQCDLCGKETNLFLADIEGTELNVCSNCSKFGRVIKEIRAEEKEKKPKEEKNQITEEPEIIDSIVADYAEIIRKKREQLGLKQEDFAKKISEKESTVHHLEIGKLEPSIELARKLERLLKINLIETIEVEQEKTKQEKSDVLTIGDILKTE
ncbi:TIGR00270 family protein [Candidatus Woesearchaeota archaeon]|nr:TIGR00270 family protein [Candidatus Woesearchaeota archaeon]